MPDIPMLQGWGDGIAQLGQGVSQLLDPNAAAREQLKRAALSDPNLIAQLGEMERANPGTLDKMGFGQGGLMKMLGHQDSPFVNQIANTPISPDTQNKRDQASATLANTKANTANTQIDTDTRTKTQKDTVSKNAAEAKTAGANADVAVATTGDKIKAEKATAEKMASDALVAKTAVSNLEGAMKKIPDISKIDLAGEARKAVAGQPMDAALAVRINSDPNLKNTWETYVHAMLVHAQLGNEMGIAELRNRSKSEQAVAFTVANTALKEADNRLKTYEAALKTPPTTADDILANSEDPTISGTAKEKIRLFHEAKDHVDEIRKTVAKHQAASDFLAQELYGKGGYKPETITPGAPPSIGAQSGVDAANKVGLAALKKHPEWSKLKPIEQKWVIDHATKP
jgi:hypothetical protein